MLHEDVEHPGEVTSDPTWGQGLSDTIRDVRLLSEKLLETEDREAAGNAYAEAHSASFAPIHQSDSWYTDLFLDVGAEANAARWRALPLILKDPSRIPEAPLSGPEVGATEEMRRRFFGEGERARLLDFAPLIRMKIRLFLSGRSALRPPQTSAPVQPRRVSVCPVTRLKVRPR